MSGRGHFETSRRIVAAAGPSSDSGPVARWPAPLGWAKSRLLRCKKKIGVHRAGWTGIRWRCATRMVRRLTVELIGLTRCCQKTATFRSLRFQEKRQPDAVGGHGKLAEQLILVCIAGGGRPKILHGQAARRHDGCDGGSSSQGSWGLGSAAAMYPLAARSQPTRLRRIGMLSGFAARRQLHPHYRTLNAPIRVMPSSSGSHTPGAR
jgi:hypothetical protein